jgi:hypothetical protein
MRAKTAFVASPREGDDRDDTSRSRDTAFEKVRARVLDTDLAARTLGGR